MHRLAIVALVALLVVGGVGVAAAQLCDGEPGFDAGATRLHANLELGAAIAFHGGVVVGRSRVFGGAEVGMTTNKADESMQYVVGVGVQLSRRPESRLHVCPSVALGITTGTDLHSTGVGPAYRETDIRLGVHAGFVLLRGRRARVVPHAAYQYVTGRLKYDYVNGAKSTRGVDPYSLVTAGVGVVFSNELTINPSVAIPLGLSSGLIPGSASYLIAVSIGL